MATTPTNLPVPSESPFDFKFNIGKIDEVVTSMGWTYTDRFGQKHYTIEGINYLSQQAMAAFGYVILTGKTFTTGATINNPNEVLLNTADGEYYKWTGTFASGMVLVVTDVAASFNVVRVRNADHTIRRIRIEGGNSKVLGINVESTATGTIVESCKVTNTGLTAIYSTASRVVARNNQTDSCGLLGTGNYRCSIWFNENEHAVMEGNICTNCAWGILMRNTIGTSQGYFNTMRNNIVVSASGTTADCQGISASAQIHLSTTDNIVRGFPNNAIDHQNCFGMIITGNQIHQCNDGVFIGDRSCGRIIISNNNIEACFTGIRYYNPSNSTPEYQNQTFADVQITNNVIYTSTSRAIWVIMTGTTSANFMTNVNGNIVDGNGSAGLGIVMDTVTYGSVNQNQVRRVRGHGIDLASCEGLRVMGNSIADAGFTTTGTYNGINLSNCNRCNASDNYAVGPSMIYSVVLGGGAYNMAYTNHARSTSGATAVSISGGTGNVESLNIKS